MRRRSLISTPVLAAGAALLGASPARAAAAPPRPLAVPLHDVNLIGARVVTLPDGTPMLYGVTNGTPAKLSGVDARTGECRFTVPLPGEDGSYSVVLAPDGYLYVGAYGSGHLFRISPDGASVADLGRPLAGQTYLWDLAVGEHGLLFGVTYPGAGLFSYDTATSAVRDYGAVTSDTKQGRIVEYVDGTVYVGTIIPPHLFAVNAETGAKTELALPPEVTAGDSVFDINAAGGRLYVRIGHDIKYSPLYALDLATGQWLGSLPDVAGLELAASPDGRVYVMHANELTLWDPVSGQSTGTGLVYPGRVYNYRGVGWVDLGDPQWPGSTLTGWFWRGEMWRYNPATGTSSVTADSTVPGEPIPVISLTTARDGSVLAGGFLGGFARVGTSDASVDFHRFSQTERLLDDGTSIWVGAYPDARGYRYDPSKPWSSSEYSPGPPGTPENPVKAWDFTGFADPQDRILSMVRAGRYLVAGTGPKGPTFGGALAVYDTVTGQARLTSAGLGDNNLAASSLAVAGGLVIVGTWTQGGSGAPTPPATQGTVFAYDPARDQVRWQASPVPGTIGYRDMLVDPDGRLWTLADSTLAELDPRTGRARRTRKLGDPVSGGPWPSGSGILQPAPGCRALYAMSGGRFWYVSTRTLTATDLGLSGYGMFTALPDGDLVLANGEQLYRWTPPASLRRPDVRRG